ncbi:MAG: GTPase ObgE [Actinobacteria bacterium]|nr:GTPase ObgE [Actinomycetota bacterium]MCL5069838.1 GTPase ObgE [Actinomycetota bacterium]
MFLDEAKINIKAGDGGNGMISFFYRKGSRKKIASGGSGGRGGNVIIKASSNVNTLYGFKKKVHFRAQNGQNGMPNNKNGKNGDEIDIEVPVGTMIKDRGLLIADLKTEGSEILIAEGGIGGRGNASFTSQGRRFPGFAEKGETVEERWIELELRLVADASLVGFPNAGKSTIISRISAARPKIADYPFTTLVPNLGVVSFREDAFVVADIPGIIEGAHQGTGLGDKFLRHIMRSKVLVIILDGQQVIYEDKISSLVETFQIMRKELKLYDLNLFKKDYLIVINKADLFQDKTELNAVREKLVKKSGKPVLIISAITGEGLNDLKANLYEKISKIRVREREENSKLAGKIDFRSYTIDNTKLSEDRLDILKEGSEFIIKCKKLERMVAMMDLGNEEALDYLRYRLKKMKIGDRLKKMGVHEGATVIIGKLVFELTD